MLNFVLFRVIRSVFRVVNDQQNQEKNKSKNSETSITCVQIYETVIVTPTIPNNTKGGLCLFLLLQVYFYVTSTSVGEVYVFYT